MLEVTIPPDLRRGQCQFCAASSTVKDRRIAQNELSHAFLSISPIVTGHCLIVPNRCVLGIENLSDAEFCAIFDLVSILKPALTKTFSAEGFNFAWNEGAVAGQTVPHFHLHLLPRRSGDTGVDPRQFLYRPGTRPSAEMEEMAETAQMIRSALGSSLEYETSIGETRLQN